MPLVAASDSYVTAHPLGFLLTLPGAMSFVYTGGSGKTRCVHSTRRNSSINGTKNQTSMLNLFVLLYSTRVGPYLGPATAERFRDL